MPIPQNGHTHSNNSLAICRRIVLSVFDHFVKLELKGLTRKVAVLISFESASGYDYISIYY